MSINLSVRTPSSPEKGVGDPDSPQLNCKYFEEIFTIKPSVSLSVRGLLGLDNSNFHN